MMSEVVCSYCKHNIFTQYALYDVKETVKIQNGHEFVTEVVDMEVVGGESINRIVCEKCLHVFEIRTINGVDTVIDTFEVEEKEGAVDDNKQ